MIQIQRLTETAMMPTKGYTTDAGYDLYSDETRMIGPKETILISTGIAAFINKPRGKFDVYFRIAPRSGLAVKHGLDIFAGVVDRGYRGEIKVAIFNSSSDLYTINRGDRIAQLIPTVIYNTDIKEVKEIESSRRGIKGFGSTGI